MNAMKFKMNTLLAKLDHTSSVFNKAVTVAFERFRSNRFKGEKKTYIPRDGYPEDTSKMGTTHVASTVKEELDALREVELEYLNQLFAVEATNSGGARTVELTVDGISFGKLTALDLMRLKSLLTSHDISAVYANIPVYSDSEVWSESTDADYAGREILETPINKGVTRTTETEEVILKDPNIDPANLPANYRAATTQKRRTVETGDYTHQRFTGEWSQNRKNELIKRRGRLLEAVTAALKDINDQECSAPNLDVEAMVNYIHNGR